MHYRTIYMFSPDEQFLKQAKTLGEVKPEVREDGFIVCIRTFTTDDWHMWSKANQRWNEIKAPTKCTSALLLLGD